MVLQPLVSIIIPAHNGEKYIKEAIQSVKNQDYLNHEIWVIDNASSDATTEVVKSFSAVNYVFSAAANTAAARNLGAQYAQGKYLAFLDQDDRWPMQKLTLQVEFLEENAQYAAVIGMQEMYLEPGCKKPAWAKEAWLEEAQYAYLPSALMVRRDVFFQYNVFDESLPLASDVDWFCRMKNLGVKIGILPEVLVHRRIHQENTSSKVLSLQKEILLSLRGSIQRERITKN